MASDEKLVQHRFVLNNGSGEIPALGFGTSLPDNSKTEALPDERQHAPARRTLGT